MNEVELITYNEVLESLNSDKSHLLLGNGFNNSLGIKTDYKSIFERMKDGYKGYEDLNRAIEADGYDIEKVIGRLKDQISEGNNKEFLDNYVNTRIKLDFMKSTHEIVKEQIKKIYQEKNEEIFLLFKRFKNYFTLNYDSFLYLLLMKFKKTTINEANGEAIAIQNTFEFQEDDMNSESEVYTKIQQAYDEGSLSIDVAGKIEVRKLNILSKTKFMSEVKEYYKNEHNGRTIEKAVNLLWKRKEEERKRILSVNDGFLFDLDDFPYRTQKTQNLFFLHGAFHIYEKNGSSYKITQKSDKALYERLEEILDNESEEVVCVFTNANKDIEINKNVYLSTASEKLLTLEGSMVIIGSSLSENDNHIFSRINKSKIDTIYLASQECDKIDDYTKAANLLTNKKIILFDRNTISYG